jgi:hypothetical protein
MMTGMIIACRRGVGVGLVMVAVAGCRGEEVARVKLSKPGDSGDASWDGKPVKVWADYQGKWKGDKTRPGLTYDVEVVEGGAVVKSTTCDTSTCSTSVCKNTVSMGGETEGNCECLMTCTLDVPAGKSYTVRAKVNGAGGTFENASLVLRQ